MVLEARHPDRQGWSLLRPLRFPVSPHGCPSVFASVLISSHKDTSQVGSGPALVTPFYLIPSLTAHLQMQSHAEAPGVGTPYVNVWGTHFHHRIFFFTALLWQLERTLCMGTRPCTCVGVTDEHWTGLCLAQELTVCGVFILCNP